MNYITEINENGFAIIPGVFSADEIQRILDAIDSADKEKSTFRKSEDLFAIRQFLREIPGIAALVFTDKLRNIISEYFGKKYFAVKSIYFNKPGKSNWFVSYHQDLTISTERKFEVPGYGPWTVKQNQFAVQPPLHILENIYTIRIHLDDTDENNGALKVIPASHKKGIVRVSNIDLASEDEVSCNVPMGGIMIMRPLLFHSSGRTVNNKSRRVIHIEFSDETLSGQLNWSEKVAVL